MNPRRKTDKPGAATRSTGARPKDRVGVTGPEEAASRCVLCRELIHHGARLCTITSGNRQFPVHAACLDRLHSLLRDAFDSPLPIPTLTRSLTLGEFLLTKRPHSDAEILACVAYYHRGQTNQPVAFTPASLDEQLRYTAFKVRDSQATLRNAVDQLAYLEACSESGMAFHRLTAKGAHLVEHLPSPGD